MIQMVRWVYLLTLAVWVGGVIFFSFVVAPTIFKVLAPQDAANLQRALFPRYYLLGIICAVAGIVSVGWLLAEHAFGKWPALFSLLLLAGMGATNLWLRRAVVPRMTVLRELKTPAIGSGQEPDAAAEAEWKSLHRLSVQLNAVVLLGGLTLLFLLVFARVV
jgi:uncharacterized membrane protein